MYDQDKHNSKNTIHHLAGGDSTTVTKGPKMTDEVVKSKPTKVYITRKGKGGKMETVEVPGVDTAKLKNERGESVPTYSPKATPRVK